MAAGPAIFYAPGVADVDDLGEPDDEATRTRLQIERIRMIGAVVSLGYLAWALWLQVDETKRQIWVRRTRARVTKLLEPCTACAERRKEARRVVWQAMEIVRGAHADD